MATLDPEIFTDPLGNHSPRFTTLQLGLGASRTAISGTDRYFLDLLRALPSAGVDIDGLVAGEPDLLDRPVPGVRSFAPLNIPRIDRWRAARKAVREGLDASDLIVTHGAFATFPVLDLVRKRPLVVHFHGPWSLEGQAEGRGRVVSAVRRYQELLNYRGARRFIVLSQSFADILTTNYGVSSEKLRVIPGGVDLTRFNDLPAKREARERLGWPLERPIVATARRLVPSKGIDRLIDAITEVRKKIPDVFCAIIGKGPLTTHLQRQIDENGLNSHVSLVGFVPDQVLALAYRAADLFVMPTVAFEGFGLAAIEALACGTPTMVTPIGGLVEAVDGLSSNLVLAGSEASQIAHGLTSFMTGELPLPTKAECEHYASRFDWSEIAKAVKDVYVEAL